MASLLAGGGLGAEAPSKVSSAIYTDSRPCFKQWQLTLGVIQAKDLMVARRDGALYIQFFVNGVSQRIAIILRVWHYIDRGDPTNNQSYIIKNIRSRETQVPQIFTKTCLYFKALASDISAGHQK